MFKHELKLTLGMIRRLDKQIHTLTVRREQFLVRYQELYNKQHNWEKGIQ